MKKFLLVILAIFAGLFLTACEDFDLNGMLGDMGLGGSSSAKFSINEELLEGNQYTISIQMKKIKAKSEFETDEDYQKYLNDTVDSIEKKLLRDATLKGNEEIISASIEALLATIQSCGSEEEILAEINKLTDKSIGNVMKHFKTNFAGKCDMRMVSEAIKKAGN